MSGPPAGSSWGPLSTSTLASRATTDTVSSMDAHRNRKIKWMSLALLPNRGRLRKSGSLLWMVFLPLYDTWYGRIRRMVKQDVFQEFMCDCVVGVISRH